MADKSNENTAAPELLRVLELSSCIVTTDAISCQKNIAKETIEADADHVSALNQETVHEDAKCFVLFEHPAQGSQLSDAAANLQGGKRPWRLEVRLMSLEMI